MYVRHNITQPYQIKEITNEKLIKSKNYINDIANRILKYMPLITSIIQMGIVFSLARPLQGHVLRDDKTTLTTSAELDEVIRVSINHLANEAADHIGCTFPYRSC